MTPAKPSGDTPTISLAHLRPISIGHRPPDERHLVADDGRGRHRLIVSGGIDAPLVLQMPFDMAVAIRLDAASRLAHAGVSDDRYQPSALQRARLVMLMRILDALHAGLGKREIAGRLIYPHMPSLRGASWKASSERRRTHRLCKEAARLRDSGIPDLLHGRLRPTG